MEFLTSSTATEENFTCYCCNTEVGNTDVENSGLKFKNKSIKILANQFYMNEENHSTVLLDYMDAHNLFRCETFSVNRGD